MFGIDQESMQNRKSHPTMPEANAGQKHRHIITTQHRNTDEFMTRRGYWSVAFLRFMTGQTRGAAFRLMCRVSDKPDADPVTGAP